MAINIFLFNETNFQHLIIHDEYEFSEFCYTFHVKNCDSIIISIYNYDNIEKIKKKFNILKILQNERMYQGNRTNIIFRQNGETVVVYYIDNKSAIQLVTEPWDICTPTELYLD